MWDTHPQQFWLRGKRPDHVVEYDENLGFWNVYGYPEAVEILGDWGRFSSNISRLFPAAESLSEGDLLKMDPPTHRKLRRLVSHAFTPKVVADLEPRIAELTRELLDTVTDNEFELVRDLAYPLPVIVIAELLGLPSSDRDLFKQWVDKIFEDTNQFSLKDFEDDGEAKQQEELRKQLDDIAPMTDYLLEHAAERRRSPRPGLLSDLVHAEVDGERLSDTEVVNFTTLLLVAGHITTTMLLGNTVLCLDANPDQSAKVRENRGTIPSAIEESLRFLSPFPAVARITNKPETVAGVEIPADQLLMVWVGAANRDARQFSDPDTFDIARAPAHLGFGRGVHFCLGAPLARLEGRIALDILLDRFPRLRTDPDRRPTFMPSPNLTGVQTLPLLTD
ncbi:cytochrome P450 [Saccharothrix deserti]|uniref:cytochrome P450 n=1 Tax=Saccharothrix deserti TaxID=2593674 RepID=UPI00131ECB29|nr:cytochrome P450 [Saccharothrix deserti]